MSDTNQISNMDYIINRQQRQNSIRLLPLHSARSLFYFSNVYSNSFLRGRSSFSRNVALSGSSFSSTDSSITNSPPSTSVVNSYQSSPTSSYSNDSDDSSVFSGSLSSASSVSAASSPLSSLMESSPIPSPNNFPQRRWPQNIAPLPCRIKLEFTDFIYLEDDACSEINYLDFYDYKKSSRNISQLLNARMYGNHIMQESIISKEFVLNHLLRNRIFQERSFDLGKVNKVFSSQWLDDRHVILGTKCNHLIVLNVTNGKKIPIETLQSRKLEVNSNGMHFIEINPSRTLLATGATYASDIAIYRLPSLEPLCILEGKEDDLIFDVCWLDDEFLASGSRESTLALWHLRDKPARLDSTTWSPVIEYLEPKSKIVGCKFDKIRSLAFDPHLKQIAALSLNAKLLVYDAVTLKRANLCNLAYDSENVCLTEEMNLHLYAIGSKGHVQLLDNRSLANVHVITSVPADCNVRSLSFNDSLLTIGTGAGSLLFYDIRNEQYLSNNRIEGPFTLKTSKGWLDPGEIQMQHILFNTEYSPAIYTHQYDQNKIRIFTAGGPLPATMSGNYAGIWS